MVSSVADTFQFVTHLLPGINHEAKKNTVSWNKLPFLSGIKISDKTGTVLSVDNIIILFGVKTVRVGKYDIKNIKPANLMLKKIGFRNYTITNISPYIIYVGDTELEPGQQLNQVQE